MNLELKKIAASNFVWKSILLLAISCILLGGWRARRANREPYIEFTKVPLTDEGGTPKLDVIEGRVSDARPEQQIVLFARSGDWYVQPFANQPFTQIQSDSRWSSVTHLGTEYAALLVEPGYQPSPVTDELPGEGGGVIAVAIVKGTPVFWQRWWFLLLCALASLSAILAFYSYWLHQSSRQLKLRFEERLAERTQVAQEFQDTLLQGIISASMQLDVAIDRVPEDLPARASLAHVLQIMRQVVEEGRDALKRLRSSGSSDSVDLEQAFSRIQQELAADEQIDFRVTVEGRLRPVHSVIRDEVYRIGREALLNAFHRSRARRIEVAVEYAAKHLRVVIRYDNGGIAQQMPLSRGKEHWELSGMRERADRIGARLKARSRAAAETEIELSIPRHIAFQSQPSKNPLKWFTVWMRKMLNQGQQKPEREESK